MKRLFIAAICMAALTANAQKKTAWPNEPKAVFGIELGAVLENDRISDCGGTKADPEKQPIAVCAMARPSYSGVQIAGFPVPGFEKGYIDREDGVVTSITLNGNRLNYEGIKKLLLERYGKPTRAVVEKLQNKMGATFTSEVLYWQGKHVDLTLSERFGTVDQTTAFFSHNEHVNKKAAERDKALRESASKM